MIVMGSHTFTADGKHAQKTTKTWKSDWKTHWNKEGPEYFDIEKGSALPGS